MGLPPPGVGWLLHVLHVVLLQVLLWTVLRHRLRLMLLHGGVVWLLLEFVLFALR